MVLYTAVYYRQFQHVLCSVYCVILYLDSFNMVLRTILYYRQFQHVLCSVLQRSFQDDHPS